MMPFMPGKLEDKVENIKGKTGRPRTAAVGRPGRNKGEFGYGAGKPWVAGLGREVGEARATTW